ncbi:ribosome-binding factor A [Tepidamorphus gemmatus]|jgi:ribosome-binding factor A|uniref:Ribosome-binding factor A n=1 Tax=Tepidamorphus gemmatus TaxID=747076 RepID=A0A4R3MJQ2_9HYPH|nr:30S ribosome-binding factor RbfA [Tepidamorphus gemmatus]TCT11985.1 ribosome-binding factor A [Tepidamorphus gemmatus]
MQQGRSARRGHGTGPSQRQLRVGEMLRHALAEILQRGDVADPMLEAVAVTVPEVRVSPDLKHATVYVMPLGGRHVGEVVAALDRHARYLRGQLARKVTLKFMPDLRFEIDRTFDAADHVDRLLRTPEVVRDLRPQENGD